MRDSYTNVHYNEENRPYTKYAQLLCEYWAKKYFGTTHGKLLDVACGRGEHLQNYQILGFDVYGVDKETLAKNKGFNVAIIDVDKDEFPFEENFFDFVILKSAIEHFAKPYHVMENVYRVLKPGGKVIISTCDWRKDYKTFYDDVDHKTPFTRCSLQDLLLRYDFKNVRVDYFIHLPFTWNSKLGYLFSRLISKILPINFPPTVNLKSKLVKLIYFSRCREILGYGEK